MRRAVLVLMLAIAPCMGQADELRGRVVGVADALVQEAANTGTVDDRDACKSSKEQRVGYCRDREGIAPRAFKGET